MFEEPEKQPLNWKPPIAVGTERLGCRWCDWSCPRWYLNQSDKPGQAPRDGNIRLATHADREHYEEIRRAKRKAAAARRRAARAGM